MPLLSLVRKVNVSHVICDHLVGKDHPRHHRIIIGGVFMVIGVGIVKVCSNYHEYIAFVSDIVGYGLHGLGLTPIIEAVLEEVEEIA